MTEKRLPTPLCGIIPPMVTPLRDQDSLDTETLERIIAHLLEGGVSGLFLLGTTGEGPALSYSLRYELIDRTCEIVAGRVPVLVGVTDPSLVEAQNMAGWAADSGAAAVVAAPPYYFPMTQADLTTWFTRLAEDSPLPVILYNIPPCTGIALSLETVRSCMAIPNIAGIKDSGGELAFFREVLQLRKQRPERTVLIGPELLLAEAVLAGADGGVCGGANLLPRLFVDVYEAAKRDDQAALAPLTARQRLLAKIYDGEREIASVVQGVKCALSLVGLCDDLMVEPFPRLGPAERLRVAGILAELGLLAPSAAKRTREME